MKPLSLNTSLLCVLALGLAACNKDADTDGDDTGSMDTESHSDSGDTEDTEDTGDTEDTDTDTDIEPADHTTAVLTTVASDYSTGSFATIDLATGTVSDSLFVSSGDPSVSVAGGTVFQINRGAATVRAYTPGDWTTPLWEVSTDELSNPHNVKSCGDNLFVSLYGKSNLTALNPETGAIAGTVDLSAYNDSEGGAPEASTLVEADGKLYVGLQRFDSNYAGEGGMVVEVDCENLSAIQAWDVGHNTNVSEWKGSGKVLVAAEAFGDDLGGVYSIDTQDGTKTLIAEIASHKSSKIAAYGNTALVTGSTADWSQYGIQCVDLDTGTATELYLGDSYINGIAANNLGHAYVTAAPSYPVGAPTGVFVYDIESCTAVSTDWLALDMYPSSVAFY